MTQVAQVEVTNPLVTMPVKDFMVNNGFTQVHREIRENTNGYPYVTFINKNNEAENIYFSKEASKAVTAGQEIKKGFFDELLIAETTNAMGEKRIKIVGKGTQRLEMDDLFGEVYQQDKL